MLVLMVQVWIMCVFVRYRLMMMPMAVGFADWIAGTMFALMVLVVRMSMFVVHRSTTGRSGSIKSKTRGIRLLHYFSCTNPIDGSRPAATTSFRNWLFRMP